MSQQSLQRITKDMKDQNIVINSNKKSPKDQKDKVSIFKLFRFAKKFDILLMVLGTIFSLANGAAMPFFALLWGDMIDSFSEANLVDTTRQMMLLFIYIGLGAFGSGWIMIGCWVITAQRQAIQCRKQYLRSLLRQQIGWFDTINQASLSSEFSADTMTFQTAIGQKISLALYIIALGISGLVIGFVSGWLLALVIAAIMPLIIFTMYLYMRNVQTKSKRDEESYSSAGGRAQQALSSIKTIKTLNGQEYQSQKYRQSLVESGNGLRKYAIIAGISTGGAFFAMLAGYSLGFWFGSNCIEGNNHCPQNISGQDYNSGKVFTVFFSIIIVGFNLSQLPPSLKKIAEGQVAAARMFRIIDREPKIQNPPNGIKITNLKGIIKFQNVTFSYPKNPSLKVLSGANFTINTKKVAFVGESGCGKSTIMQLLMRFYDPDEGKITLDGHDLRQIDLIWLRQAIGYVGQQPVLFATTIKQNLLFAKENATDVEIGEALKKAEAYNFVMNFEKKLETYVGQGGGQISGGQKQRIAISRALLRNPQILLLDEATSALDRKNQKLIQKTLEQVSKNRLSITIAHRIKTVMNCDIIYVLENGKVIEQGKFHELQRFKGLQYENDEEEEENKQKQNIEQDPKLTKKQSKKLKGFISFEMGEDADRELTKQQLQKKQKEELLEVYQRSTYRRVISYAGKYCGYLILGAIIAVINGTIYPVFSIFISRMLEELMVLQRIIKKELPSDFFQEHRDQINIYALIFLLLGVAGFILSTLQIAIFQVIGHKIATRIRQQVFHKMLKLPIPFYQQPRNGVGSLTTRLEVDSRQTKQMVTTYIYGVLQNLSCLLTGIIIAFVFEWRTALVSLGLMPLLIVAGAIRMAFRNGSAMKAQQSYKNSSNIIMEAMSNIRTVCSFGYENIILGKYEKIMQLPYSLAIKNGIISGFFYGLAQLIMFIVIGLIFFLGSVFVAENDLSVSDMFTAVFAIFFSGMTVGNNSHILPDMNQCKISAANLFLILDTEDQQQKQIHQKSKMLKQGINGNITLHHIKFKYESRNDYLFSNFSLTLKEGQKSAFVGTSGCGKSTIMSLLLRFYDPESGLITINDINIKDFDLHYLRSQFGVVSQEPVLFNTSFKENIKYNCSDATDNDVRKAATDAYAIDFIEGKQTLAEVEAQAGDHQKKLKQITQNSGFQRQIGVRGSHISGGQKQRVAIARAILRKPKILLLDEATSALDNTNEKKVQQCLDNLMVNNTTITIAHRIDTIKNSSIIHVFDKGRIVESGKYHDLVAKKGYFYNLERGTQFL